MRSLAFGLAFVLTSSGCAAMMKQPLPSDWQPQEMPRCSQSNGGAVIDGVFVAMYGVGGLAAAANDEGGLGLGLVVLGGLHLASAISGYSSASRCQKALDEHEAFLLSEKRGRNQTRAAHRPERGTRGGGCYSDATCDEGLTCHPETKICVLAHFSGARAGRSDRGEEEPSPGGLIDLSEEAPDDEEAPVDVAPPAKSRVVRSLPAPARESPAASGAEPSDNERESGASSTKPRAPAFAEKKPAPRGEQRRPSKPTPPREAASYRDFWREVRR